MTLSPPAVEPAHPPMNMRRIRTTSAAVSHWSKSAVMKPVVVMTLVTANVESLSAQEVLAWASAVLAALVCVAAARPPYPASWIRVKFMTQFVSQVPPSSAENACSQRALLGVMPDQRKRT